MAKLLLLEPKNGSYAIHGFTGKDIRSMFCATFLLAYFVFRPIDTRVSLSFWIVSILSKSVLEKGNRLIKNRNLLLMLI